MYFFHNEQSIITYKIIKTIIDLIKYLHTLGLVLGLP